MGVNHQCVPNLYDFLKHIRLTFFYPYIKSQWGPKLRSARINISVLLKKDSMLLLLKIRSIFFSFVDEQYTCGPLVYSVYGHVAGVTRSTTVKAEEAARWRSIIAVTAENKYQIIKSLNHYLKQQKGDNNITGEDGILSISTRMCATADQHCLSQTTTDVQCHVV